MRFPLLLIGILFTHFLLGQNEFRLERVKTIPDNATVNDILVHKNNIFIAASTGLYQIDASNLETRLISKQHINAVCASGNNVWASIDNRFLQNMATGESTSFGAPGLEVRDLEYSQGKVWVATNQGIFTVITRSNELGRIEYDKRSGLPSNDIAFIHIDKQKQMWIGTDKGIVFINKKDKWKTYEKKLSMEAMHYNHEGLWLVSNQEMWVVDDFNRWYPAAIDRGLRKGKIRDITADSTGRLYMASDILVRYDPYDETIESYADNTSIVSKVCTSVESDRDNRIWLGTKGGGLFLFGYAEEARTVEDLIASRDKKIEAAQNRDVPIVEERLVVAVGEEPVIEALSDGGTTVASTTAQVASTVGISAPVANTNAITQEKTKIPRSEGKSDRGSEQTEKNTSVATQTFDRLALQSNEIKSIKCYDDLAQVSLEITGGKPPYKINWEGEERKELIQDLSAGQYKINVTDALGQQLTTSVTVKGVSPLELKVINKKSPSALGRKDGNVKVSAQGGVPPYQISWSNGEEGDRARRLENGVHTVTVKDANGCSTIEEIVLKAKIMADLAIEKVTVGQKLEIKNIYFEADSTELEANSSDVLDEVYEFLTENTEVKIEIGGHTNNLPPDEYCDRISSARAKSVAEYLFSKGIPEDRITYRGYGKRDPIASNETKEGRRRNQRVELEIISK